MALTLRQKRPVRGMEAVAVRPDGTRVSFIPYPTPLFDEAGELVGAVNMLVDITERRTIEEALAKRRDEQAALYRYTDRLYRAETAQEVYAASLDAIAAALTCQRASILLCDDNGVMRFAAWRGLSDAYRFAVEGHSPWPCDAVEPAPICIGNIDTADIPSALKETIKGEGIAALAFMPLLAKSKLIGKFMVYFDAPRIFSENEIDLAVTVARQLAFSLEQIKAEEARTRAELARKAAERNLDALNRFARAIFSELDVQSVVQKVIDSATELSGARSGACFCQVTNVRGESYQLCAHSGASSQAFERLVVHSSTALFEPARRGEGIMRLDDIQTDSAFDIGADDASGCPPVGSYLAVPVQSSSGGVRGGLFLSHDQPGIFTQEAEDMVLGIAAHAAIALENARLYQAATRLSAIVETSDDAIVGKDLNGIVTSWNEGARRLFGYTPEEIVGKPITTIIPPDRRIEEPEILNRIRRGEPVNHYETVRQRKDGSLIDVSLSVSPIKDAMGRVVGASKIARDISERKRAEERRELLTREIYHRTRNLFAVVLSVVARSFAGKRTVEEAQAAVLSRVHSLAQTHTMLIDRDWQGADIAEVVRSETKPYSGRVTIEGPSVLLNAQMAQNFALALHELGTNAAKYGSLSNAVGRVYIRWSLEGGEGGKRLVFHWQEFGGPPVKPPERKGFGSAVLEFVMASYSEEPARIEFAPEGVSYRLTVSLN